MYALLSKPVTDPALRPAIGASEDGIPIEVMLRGAKHASARVLVLAGQHGDEWYATGAAELLLKCDTGWPQAAQLAVIARANPDGATLKRRTNRNGVDLNRDHILLRAGETRAVHRFIRDWAPDVVVDVHNYPSRRASLLERDLVRSADVCLDIPTHPALWTDWSETAIRDLIGRVGDGIEPIGATCERYTVLKRNGRARPSTFGVSDARNGIALRHGIFSVLLEGRAPTRFDTGDVRARLLGSLAEALRLCVQWATDNIELIGTWRATIRARDAAIGWKQHNTGAALVRCLHRTTGEPVEVAFERYRSGHRVTQFAAAPAAYAIPRSLAGVLEVLERHGIEVEEPAGGGYPVEKSRLTALRRSRGTVRPRVLDLETGNTWANLTGYRIVPVNDRNRVFLAVLLEAKSRYALHGYPYLGMDIGDGGEYPIVRVLERKH